MDRIEIVTDTAEPGSVDRMGIQTQLSQAVWTGLEY